MFPGFLLIRCRVRCFYSFHCLCFICMKLLDFLSAHGPMCRYLAQSTGVVSAPMVMKTQPIGKISAQLFGNSIWLQLEL